MIKFSPLILFILFARIAYAQIIYTPGNISLNRPQAPLILSAIPFNTTCGKHDGGIAINASNGTPPYQYKIINVPPAAWRNNGLFGNLIAGNYRVYVKDALSLIDSLDVTITNTGSAPLLGISDILPSTSGCHNTYPALTLTVAGGQAPYLFTYDFISMQNSPVFNNLYPGLYNWAVQDANGCTDTYQSMIDFHFCNFSYGLGSSGSACGNTQVVNITSSYSGATNTRRCEISADGAPDSLVAHAYGPGLHLFRSRDTITGDTSMYAVSTLKICRFTVHERTIQPDCNGQNGSVKLTGINGTAPYIFSEDGFNFSSTDSFYNLKPGIYTYAVKDASGTIVFVQVELVGNCPAISITSTPTNCGFANGTIKVSGSGGMLPYVYSLDVLPFQTNNLFTGLAQGQHKVILQDAGGFKDSAVVTIQGGGCLSAILTITNASCLQPGSIVVTASDGQAPYTYSLDSISFQSLNIFNGLAGGVYTVYVKDNNAVVIKNTATVHGTSIPVFNLGSDTSLCDGKALPLYPGIHYPGATYSWSNGATDSTVSATTSNDYWLKITTVDGCVWADTIHVTFKELPAFDLGADTAICEKDTLILNAAVTGATNYLWSTLATASRIEVTGQDFYWCEVTKNGCIYRDSITLTVNTLPVVNLGKDTTLCEGQQLKLQVLNDSAYYKWQDNSTSDHYIVVAAGEYIVEVNKSGCIVADTINVTYRLKPVFSLGANQVICNGQTVLLHPVLDPLWELLWQDGSNKSFYKVELPGTYFLDATNNCGTARSEIMFTAGACDVYVPTAFSPNGDTRNDQFKALGTELVNSFYMQIFNRYGELVFETKDKNQGWNGLLKGNPADAGAYVYWLQYRDSNSSQMKVLKGSFLLVK